MRVRLLGIVAALVLLAGPATATAAVSAGSLVASATVPGAAVPQTATYDLRALVKQVPGARVVRRPDAATAVVAIPGIRQFPRGHRMVEHRLRTMCGLVRLTASLHFEPVDPLALVKALAPTATIVNYFASSETLQPLGAGTGDHIVALAMESTIGGDVSTTSAQVRDWHRDGRSGLAALTASNTRTSHHVCRAGNVIWNSEELLLSEKILPVAGP